MRYIPVLVFFVVTNCLFAQSLSDSAQKAYKNQEFKLAIGCYEEIQGQGWRSPDLYYNLGNAYYKDNQLGKAIYYYELAAKMNPGDDDIKTNLAIANSKIIDKVESRENSFAASIQTGILSLFSLKGWAGLSICALSVSLLFLTLFIISKRSILRRLGFWSALICLFICLGAILSGYADLHQVNKKNQGIVLSQVTEVMNAPDTNAKAKFSLHEGTRLTILSTNEEWTSIKLANGNEGWIPTRNLGLF